MPDWLKALILSAIICGTIAVLSWLSVVLWPAHAEGWDTDDPDLASWFATQVVKHCCDRRDAYLADGIDGDGENIIAVITDGSANERYDKPAIPNGTRIVVPRDRIKLSPPVPGGHAVIFLSKDYSVPPENRNVYCYFPRYGL
jgi:hypothetical protein